MPRFNEIAGHAAQTQRSLLLSIRIAHPNMSEVLPLPLNGDRRRREMLSSDP